MITIKEYCARMGWPYPLPEPGTVAAERFIERVLASPVHVYENDRAPDFVIEPNQFPRKP